MRTEILQAFTSSKIEFCFLPLFADEAKRIENQVSLCTMPTFNLILFFISIFYKENQYM
ncbi:unnamed protein product, partial [Gulo gulo]